MATSILQQIRDTPTNISTYVGYPGQLVVDNQNWVLYLMDGVTEGGHLISGGGGEGGVSQVGLTDGSTTPIYSISNSPVTSVGTLTFTLETQDVNLVFAGPSSGSPGQPTFRALVNDDFPTSGVTAGSYSTSNITVNSQGIITAASNGAGGVTEVIAGNGISVSAETGNVTVTNTGVTSLSGTSNQVVVSGSTGAITLSLPQSINTSNSVQFYSLGVGTGADGTAGDIFASGTVYAEGNIEASYSSDLRLKENVKNLTDSLDKIAKINGVEFDWIDTHLNQTNRMFVNKHDVGVIAQEVKAVLPEVVNTKTDGYLGVKYEKLVPLLIEGIKELTKRIEMLEAK